jgi:hypothetical protein
MAWDNPLLLFSVDYNILRSQGVQHIQFQFTPSRLVICSIICSVLDCHLFGEKTTFGVIVLNQWLRARLEQTDDSATRPAHHRQHHLALSRDSGEMCGSFASSNGLALRIRCHFLVLVSLYVYVHVMTPWTLIAETSTFPVREIEHFISHIQVTTLLSCAPAL